ncbi:MAG TPA: glycosyl hydrolase [Tepidisphaeraceae bacterium]
MNIEKRIIRWMTVAALLTASGFAPAAPPATQTRPGPATRPAIVLEAEDAEPHGTLYATARPGFTGDGYVTGFDGGDDRLIFRIPSAAGGLYAVDVRYSAQQIKGFNLHVNGVGREDFFQPSGDRFATHTSGKIELRPGENVVELRKGWGAYDIDRMELIPTEPSTLKKPPATLVNPAAGEPAKRLMRKLVDGYGGGMLSGVQGRREAQKVFDRTGVWPAIMGGDLIEYSPSRVARGAKPAGTVERWIEDAAAGYVVVVMWHWNAPSGLIDQRQHRVNNKTVDASWYRGFYTEATTFDVAAALADPKGEAYGLLLRDIDVMAGELKKLDAAGTPVLWRPLHEADGGWFWWGAKGPDAFKQLWALMYDRLTNHHKLNNLIWMYTGTARMDWYPPDDQFDMIGVDAYPPDVRDPLSATWEAIQARYGGRKVVALSEFGGVPDVEAMHRAGVRYAYFMSWDGKQGPDKMSVEDLRRIYLSPGTVNRGAK